MEAVEDSILESEVPSSDYQPPASEWDSLLIQSPICRRLRRRRRRSTPDRDRTERPTSRDGDDDDDANDEDTCGARADAENTPSQSFIHAPSRTAEGSRGGNKRQTGSYRASQRLTSLTRNRPPNLGPYCTALCLQGLIDALPLDTACPNLHLHPCLVAHRTQHAMNAAEF